MVEEWRVGAEYIKLGGHIEGEDVLLGYCLRRLLLPGFGKEIRFLKRPLIKTSGTDCLKPDQEVLTFACKIPNDYINFKFDLFTIALEGSI